MSEVDYEAVAKEVNHLLDLQSVHVQVEFGEKDFSLKLRSKERVNPEDKRNIMRLIWPILAKYDACPGWVEWKLP